MGEMSKSLVDAVKKLAFRTSVDQLRQKGVKQVNVVGLDRLAGLIEEAVKRSLSHRLAGLERDAVADATKEEFLRLLRKNQTLEKEKDEIDRMRAQAEIELATLRTDIERDKSLLAERLHQASTTEQARYAGENQVIARHIDQLLSEHASGGGDIVALRDKLIEATIGLLDKERKAAVTAREAARDRDVEMLERRLEKMKEALADNEKLMAQAAAMAPGDPGIASIYKSVQGIASSDANLARKKEIMAGIFTANLSLQKKPSSSPAPGPT